MTTPPLQSDTQATLLLCGRFGAARSTSEVRPLSLKEYNGLAAWLGQQAFRPGDLVEEDTVLGRLPTHVLDPVRVRDLLARGAALAFAVEEWERKGIWILSRADTTYPVRLRSTLKAIAPPLLYGAGDRALLDGPTLGVVGSRNADADDLDFTQAVAERCVAEGVSIVSGGAKGVDIEAMLGALDAGGRAVGVLPEGIEKPAVSRVYRDALASGRLALVSSHAPGTRWSVANAMGRNKVIYGLSDGVLVVASGTDGGTWEGATEALRHGWSRVFVRVGGVPDGNQRLLDRGAHAWPTGAGVQETLATREPRPVGGNGTGDLFAPPAPPPDAATDDGNREGVEEPTDRFVTNSLPGSGAPSADGCFRPEIGDLFPVVWPSLTLAFVEDVGGDHLRSVADSFCVSLGQLQAWLKHAEVAGLVVRSTRPVRYRATPAEPFE